MPPKMNFDKPRPLHLNAGQVRHALRQRYSGQEAAIVFEVAAATGFSANRHLDAIAMDLWPSRGLALTGIEIKVNYHDWRRELAQPAKAEELAQYTDYFYVAAPENLIPVEELPEAWGLLEVNDKLEARITKKATKTEARAFGRPFLAAMIRAAHRAMDKDEQESQLLQLSNKMEAEFEQRVKRDAARMSENNSKDAENWRKLVEAITEEEATRLYDNDDLINCIRAIRASGVTRSWAGLQGAHDAAARMASELAPIMKSFGIKSNFKPEKKGTVPKPRRRDDNVPITLRVTPAQAEAITSGQPKDGGVGVRLHVASRTHEEDEPGKLLDVGGEWDSSHLHNMPCKTVPVIDKKEG